MTSTNQTTAPATDAPAPAKPKKTGVPCGCGCGETTKPGSRFLQGHDARVPLGAACRKCKKTATLAVGKVPTCDAHAASTIREVANGDKRASVRVLPPKPARQAPAA